MSNERTPLNFEDDDDILAMASKPSIKPKIDPEKIKEVANKAGFVSRQPHTQTQNTTPRRRRKISPYSAQLGIKVRPEIKEIFQNISDTLDIHDCSTFEQAILALIEKENFTNLLEKYTHSIEK